MTDLKMLPFGLSLETVPSIHKHGYEFLEDAPHLHRWRAVWSADGDTIDLQAYPVVKATPCGVWIDKYAWMNGREWHITEMQPTWINNDSGQSWAKKTQDDAIKGLAIRLCRWTRHIARDARRATAAVRTLKMLRPDLATYADVAKANIADIGKP